MDNLDYDDVKDDDGYVNDDLKVIAQFFQDHNKNFRVKDTNQ